MLVFLTIQRPFTFIWFCLLTIGINPALSLSCSGTLYVSFVFDSIHFLIFLSELHAEYYYSVVLSIKKTCILVKKFYCMIDIVPGVSDMK